MIVISIGPCGSVSLSSTYSARECSVPAGAAGVSGRQAAGRDASCAPFVLQKSV